VSPKLSLEAGFRWLDARSTRERVVLFGGTLAVIIGLWQAVLMDPVARERAVAANDLPTLATELPALTQRVAQLETALRADPDAAARERKAALESERASLDTRLAELTDGLIPPDEMAGALRELLRREPGLQLLKLEALPAEPLFVDDKAATQAELAKPRPAVFKHAVVIELRGSYLATLRYVQSVEELRWRFFWDSFDFRVDEKPGGRVKLTLYSLSLREGWLGV